MTVAGERIGPIGMAGINLGQAFKLAAALTTFLMLDGPASGEIKVLPGVENNGENEIVAADRHVRYTFVISNTSDADAIIKITPQRTLRRRAIACPACDAVKWLLNGTPIEKLAHSSSPLPRGAEAQLTMEGELPELDIYEAAALVDELSGKDRASSTIARVRIVRRLPDLGQAPIVAIPGGRYLSGAKEALSFRLTNGGDYVVNLVKPPAVRLREDEGGGKYAIALSGDPIAANCTPEIKQDKGLRLLPGDRTECLVPIPALGPGEYRAFITTDQDGLVPQEATADFSVRSDWLWAALWLTIGSLLGAFFAFFQGSLQRRLIQEAQALELREAYFTFGSTLESATQPDTARITSERLDALTLALEDLRHGASRDYKDALASAATLLPYLRALAKLEPAYLKKQNADTTDAFNAVLQLMAVEAPDAASIAPAVEKLRELLTAAPISVRGFAPDLGLTARAARMLPDRVRAKVLRATSTTLQLFFSAISLCLSVVIGVDALWVPNASWGSLFDITVAILTGIAATAAGTMSLQTLAQPFVARLKT